VARGTFVDHGGITQPAPAPRFSRTTLALDRMPPAPGDDTEDVLAELGYAPTEIEHLRTAGAAG
jgi:alpha-methylacyl-CoA racemase